VIERISIRVSYTNIKITGTDTMDGIANSEQHEMIEMYDIRSREWIKYRSIHIS
jgi:hypothetical protein